MLGVGARSSACRYFTVRGSLKCARRAGVEESAAPCQALFGRRDAIFFFLTGLNMGGALSSEDDQDVAGTGGGRNGRAADEVRQRLGSLTSLCCV